MDEKQSFNSDQKGPGQETEPLHESQGINKENERIIVSFASQDNKRLIVPFSLSALILLVLSSAHIWFSQVASAIIVTLVALYLFLDIRFPQYEPLSPTVFGKSLFLLRLAIVFSIILLVIFLPTGWEMLARAEIGPASHANDGLLQTEIAISFLMEGKNPYAESFFGTILEEWQGGEPPFTPVPGPLHHYVYLPLTFLNGVVPFVLFSDTGWYDHRIVHLVLLLVTLLLLTQLCGSRQGELLLLMTVGLNFLFVFQFIEGRNDITILVWMIMATVLLAQNRVQWASVVLGLALATKHQAWLFLPFFFAHTAILPVSKQSIRHWTKVLWPMAAIVLLIMGPFILWEPAAFFEDTIGYIIGLSEHSFPIRGIGFSHLLVATGILPSYDADFPFMIFSLAASIPVLIWGIRRQIRNNTLRNMWLAFACFALTFQFFSRFFNDNYYVFVVIGLCIAAITDIDEPTDPVSQTDLSHYVLRP